MKSKRFEVKRLDFEIEANFRGKLYLFLNFFRLIKFAKIQPCILDRPMCKPLYLLFIPKVTFTRV